MPKTIIHYHGTARLTAAAPPPWEEAVTGRGFTLLKAATPKQAGFLTKSNDCIAILIDLEPGEAGQAAKVQGISDALGSVRIFIIGMELNPLPPAERAELAWAGLHALLPGDAPTEFLIHQIKNLQALHDLRRFEEDSEALTRVALETRRQLHDLNQPLTALMGRLQLIEATLPDDDPTCRTIRDLIPLTQKMGSMIGDLQNYHRQFNK